MFRIVFIAGLILGIYFLVKDFRPENAGNQQNINHTRSEENAKPNTNKSVNREISNSREDILENSTEKKHVKVKMPQEFHADRWLQSQREKLKSRADLDGSYITDMSENENFQEIKLSDNELDSLKMDFIEKIEKNYSTIMAD